ncbi:MAG: T9SS type A sorting domain-containing protein [Ignavibacteriales bacterium]|nr:T9SS type A sorting domain-containing protein [Ignavibacteriales bacterium]
MSGYTKKGNNPGCGCHTSNPSTSVTLTFSGPTTLNTGETGNYSVLMTYTSNINGGGIDIAASNGTLIKVDSRLKVLNGELTQPSKQTGTTQLVWNFKYTAPATAGQQTLYASGCAVKNRWNHAPNYLITVTTPNPASLSILTPVTGNSLLSGAIANITWNSANVANVKLEYSTNSGTNWLNIISSTAAASGTYAWTVPSTPSGTCVVRVSDVTNATLNSISGVFAITAPASLSILTPVTGNSLLSGAIANITWNSANVANVKLEYSIDSGTNWLSIIGSTPAEAGSYSWTVPETPSQTCVVRVSNVLDTTLNSVSGVFTITVPIPEYNISHLRLNTSSGVSQDTGKVVTVRGVITVGNEFNSPSFIQDSTGGLAVFGRGAGQFSSSVKIGDLVKVTGKVVNYNGLTEINPVSEFLILDSGVTTQPEEMTIPDILTQVWDGEEAHEGKLVKIMEVVLSSYTPIWEGNTNYTVINGTDSLTIRIQNGTELVGKPAPNGSFNLTGVVSQYKPMAPFSGGYELIPRFIADVNITTAVGDKELNLTDFRLDQNFPNPFNPSTMISFTIPVESSVTLKVFNSIGEEVALLSEGMRAAGRYSLSFNAEKMVSGVYFYKLTAQPSNGTTGFSEIKKLILLK